MNKFLSILNIVRRLVIGKEINILMAKITDVQADVVELKAAVAEEISAVNKKLADLAAQVAAGGVATQADLDGLHTDLTGVVAALKVETDSTK